MNSNLFSSRSTSLYLIITMNLRRSSCVCVFIQRPASIHKCSTGLEEKAMTFFFYDLMFAVDQRHWKSLSPTIIYISIYCISESSLESQDYNIYVFSVLFFYWKEVLSPCECVCFSPNLHMISIYL